uniref:Uncharacterized protein n=1 Tax=Callorhinchus milii TaxID=7868 RepID=A0A4W3KIJ5_CALMI
MLDSNRLKPRGFAVCVVLSEGELPFGEDLGGVDAEAVFKGVKVFTKLFKKGRKMAKMRNSKSQSDVRHDESTEGEL